MDTDDLEGSLGTVTDEEWRVAHEALRADILADAPDAAPQFDYEWTPGEAVPGGE